MSIFLNCLILAHKLVKKNANIDWQNQTCDEIDQQFRAISEIVSMYNSLLRWLEHLWDHGNLF